MERGRSEWVRTIEKEMAEFSNKNLFQDLLACLEFSASFNMPLSTSTRKHTKLGHMLWV